MGLMGFRVSGSDLSSLLQVECRVWGFGCKDVISSRGFCHSGGFRRFYTGFMALEGAVSATITVTPKPKQ